DELTYNALVYGALNGLALLELVLIGTTVAALINWAAVVRLLPNGLTGLAVAGSIAFAFIPQTVSAFGDIREAQAARGHRLRGLRDLAPILVPLLALGLERATTLSESMESRGFGAPVNPRTRTGAWPRFALALALTLAITAAYLIAVGRIE